MSATRLIILGILQDGRPQHGYSIRHELQMWNVDKWTNIAYGSIYSALSKMADDGFVEIVNTEQVSKSDKRSPRTEYVITKEGKEEFLRLLRDFWWTWKPTVDPFQVAITFMHRLSHEELLDALRFRAEILRSFLKAFQITDQWKLSHPDTPRHIAENLRLSRAHSEVELLWVEETIGKVERGELP